MELDGLWTTLTNCGLKFVTGGHPYLDTGPLEVSNGFGHAILQTILDGSGT
jgi:hypothetical protein